MNPEIKQAILEQFRLNPEKELTLGNLVILLKQFPEKELEGAFAVMLVDGSLISRVLGGVIHATVNDNHSPEDSFIVCLTKQMGGWNPRAVVSGSVVKKCFSCGTSVYISPNGQEMLKQRPKSRLVCNPCMEKFTENQEEDIRFGVVPGALEEIIKRQRGEE